MARIQAEAATLSTGMNSWTAVVPGRRVAHARYTPIIVAVSPTAGRKRTYPDAMARAASQPWMRTQRTAGARSICRLTTATVKVRGTYTQCGSQGKRIRWRPVRASP
jgi:hypothetical protein